MYVCIYLANQNINRSLAKQMMRLERKYELLMKSALELTLIKLIYSALCLLFLLDLIRVNILLHYFV